MLARLAGTLAEAERELAAVTGRARGPVAIGAVPGKVVALAAETVGLLARTRPELEPRLVETEAEPGLADLRLGALDVLIFTDDRPTAAEVPPGCAAMVIVEAEYRIAVPDDWETPKGAADLTGRPWIVGPPDSARGRCFARFAAEHGVIPSVQHLARNPYSLQALAKARLGAILAPRYMADAFENVTITDLPVTGSYLVRTLYRTTPAAEAVTHAVKQAALRRAEHEVKTGEYPREIVVKRLVDPSEQA